MLSLRAVYSLAFKHIYGRENCGSCIRRIYDPVNTAVCRKSEHACFIILIFLNERRFIGAVELIAFEEYHRGLGVAG